MGGNKCYNHFMNGEKINNNEANEKEGLRERARKLGEKIMGLLDLENRQKGIARERRLAMRDIAGAGFKKDADERRFFEEARDEEDRLIEEEMERQRQRRIEEEKRRMKAEERRRLERDLIEGMDKYRRDVYGITFENESGAVMRGEEGRFRYGKVDGRFQKQRIQEASERAFNETLTPLEEIEAYAESGDERISAREVKTENGKKVKVYDLKGFPMRFLTTAIDYKKDNPLDRIGWEMSEALQKNPALWDRKRDEITNGDSDCISLSYIDTDINLFRLGNTGERNFRMRYGFDHVLPDSILSITHIDGGTMRNFGKARDSFLSRSDAYIPEELARRSKSEYNEVQIRRFDEVGRPRRPDYIVVYDEKEMKTMLRHAEYFGIPILNINVREYEKQEINGIVSEVKGIMERGEEASYEEIREVWQRIQSSTAVRGVKNNSDNLETMVSTMDASANEEIKEFLDYELRKRVERFQDELEKSAESLKRAHIEGKPVRENKGKIVSVQRLTRGVNASESSPDKLIVNMKLDTGRNVEMTVSDGGRFDGGAGYERGDGQKCFSSSEVYRAILPGAEKYLDVLIEAEPDDYFAKKEIERRRLLDEKG